MALKSEVKKAWVEALRSGRYKQGKGRLRSLKDEFCCLGVLCDLGERKAWEQNPGDDYYTYMGVADDFSSALLPETVQKAAGLEDQGTLIRMNDAKGMSFAEIADWIEANL